MNAYRLVTFFTALLIAPLLWAQSTPTAPPTDMGSTAETAPSHEARLRSIEERIVGLKESIFRSKSRLMLLQEEILQNIISEARAVIVHRDDMGSAFKLERVAYFLDTEPIFVQEKREGVADTQARVEVFNGNVSPGNHLLSVEMTYRGEGTLFSYLDGYRFELKSNYTFYAAKGRVVQITTVGYQKGGLTTDLVERPAIKYELQQFQYSDAPDRVDVPTGSEKETQ